MPTEPTNPTPAAIGDAYDEGLDLLNLPPVPWTVEKLGRELYGKLARVSGVCNPDLDPNFTPAIDPRAFAQGRKNHRARMLGLILAPDTIETNEHLEAWFNKLLPNEQAIVLATQDAQQKLNDETAQIEELLTKALPAPTGTPRAAGAQKLTPSKLIVKKRVF